MTMAINASAYTNIFSTTKNPKIKNICDSSDYYLKTQYHVGSWLPADNAYISFRCLEFLTICDHSCVPVKQNCNSTVQSN